jgi:hypothetical protein
MTNKKTPLNYKLGTVGKTIIFNPLNPDPVRIRADPDSSALYFTVPDTVPILPIKYSVKL